APAVAQVAHAVAVEAVHFVVHARAQHDQAAAALGRPHREHVADRPAARLGLAPADAGRALVVAGVRAPPALAPRIAVGREGDHARAAAAEVHGAVDVAAQVAAAAIHAHARVHREAVAAP